MIHAGAGDSPTSHYRSVVYYQQRHQRWMETLKVWGALGHRGWGGAGLQPLQAPPVPQDPAAAGGPLQGRRFGGAVLGAITGTMEVVPGSQHDPWMRTQHGQHWGGCSWEWALQPSPRPSAPSSASLVDWEGCGVGLQQWAAWHSLCPSTEGHCPGGGSAHAPCPHLGTGSHPDRCSHRGRPQDTPEVHLPPPLLQRL